MAVKFGLAFGSSVTVISRGSHKKQSALTELKATHYIDSTDVAAMTAAAGTFDFIIDTISAEHDVSAMMGLLATNGKCVMVGAPPSPFNVHAFSFIGGRKTLSGSLIGGIAETQEMLDFCGRHNIVCDVEVIKASYVNEAYDRTMKSDVKYRFVIDNSTI